MADSKPHSNAETLAAEARTELKAIRGSQRDVLAALDLMLDTLGSQTRLLQELASFARDDPAPSPLTKSLDAMTDAILTIDKSLAGVAQRLDRLPQEIAEQLERHTPGDTMRENA